MIVSVFSLLLFFSSIISPQEFAEIDIKIVSGDETIELLRADTFKNELEVSDIFIDGQNVTTLQKGSFRKLLSLKIIKIQNSKLKSIQPKAFENLPNLRVLNLNMNHLEKIEKHYFKNLTITHLYLSGNAIREIQESSFYNLKSLELLDLSKNNIQVLGPHMFKGTYYLQKINLSFNKLSALPHQCFSDAFSSVVTGQDAYLDLSDNKISYLSSKSISGINILKKLDLKNNVLEQLDPNFLKHFVHLDILDVENNLLKALNRNILSKLVHSEEINLGGNPWNCGFVKKYKQWYQRFNKTNTIDFTVMTECNET